jgi:Fe2+ transport system protein FeoA
LKRNLNRHAGDRLNRFHTGALGALALLLGACKVEQTPQALIDRRLPVQEERAAAAEELRDRLLAMGGALQRGDAAEALTALAPAPDAYVVSPQAALEVLGPEQIGAVLASLAGDPVAVEVRDVAVEMGPLADVAWFRAGMAVQREGVAETMVRITGVYLRREGEWRLVQAHLSTPITPPAPPPPSPSESAAAPAAGE